MNIIGRLTRDAEVRTLSNKKQVVNFSIATNDNYRNKQGERIEQTTFDDYSYWISSKVAELFIKGTLVELIGRVYTRAWVGEMENPHAGLNFHTSQIKFLSSSKKTDKQTTQSENSIEEKNSNSKKKNKDEDLPF